MGSSTGSRTKPVHAYFSENEKNRFMLCVQYQGRSCSDVLRELALGYMAHVERKREAFIMNGGKEPIKDHGGDV